LPDHEQHLVEWMEHPRNRELVDGKLAYQWRKQQAAMEHVKKWRAAVDVGAHCGLWSMHLTKRFTELHAFEPVAEHRSCWERNVMAPAAARALLYPVALGEADGSCSISTKNTSSGDSRVQGPGDIPIRRLDDYDLQDVDFIKLDCEGYELFALRGAEETLKRCRPCVIVEQKPNRPAMFKLPSRGSVDFLRELGAILRQEISGDFIMSWD
jgi:FkbM family methyltransferase